MKKKAKIIAAALLSVIMLTAVFVTVAFAGTSAPVKPRTTYNFETANSQFGITKSSSSTGPIVSTLVEGTYNNYNRVSFDATGSLNTIDQVSLPSWYINNVLDYDYISIDYDIVADRYTDGVSLITVEEYNELSASDKSAYYPSYAESWFYWEWKNLSANQPAKSLGITKINGEWHLIQNGKTTASYKLPTEAGVWTHVSQVVAISNTATYSTAEGNKTTSFAQFKALVNSGEVSADSLVSVTVSSSKQYIYVDGNFAFEISGWATTGKDNDSYTNYISTNANDSGTAYAIKYGRLRMGHDTSTKISTSFSIGFDNMSIYAYSDGYSGDFATAVNNKASLVNCMDAPARYSTAYSATSGASEGLELVLNNKGGYTLVGRGSCTDTDIVIPETYNNRAVNEIAYRAFFGNRLITSVTVPKSVDTIGDYAFAGCTSLSEITVADDNTVYKSSNGVLYTEDGTQLIQYPIGKTDSYVEVPEGVTSIGPYAFYKAVNVVDLLIPSTIQTIESNLSGSDTPVIGPDGQGTAVLETAAFSGCTALSNVYYDGYKAEYENVYVAEGNECFTEAALYYMQHDHIIVNHEGKAATCTEGGYLPYETCELCDYTTYQKLDPLGHNKVSVDAKAADCLNVGWNAYEYCTRCDYTTYSEIEALGHSKVFVDAKAADCFNIGWNAYEYCTKCDYTTYEEIPITHEYVARKCTLCGYILASENLSFELKSDGTYEVSHGSCYDAEVGIPATHLGVPVTSIANAAFYGCGGSLVSIVLPDSITSIGNNAFQSCKLLETIDMGNSVVSIGNGAFDACFALEGITLSDTVTAIGDTAFYGCKALKSITIPNNVISVGVSAFRSCTSLESVTIGNSVTTLGEMAFNGCTALKSVIIPDSVTAIGIYTFDGCASLASVKIGKSVASIGDSAFARCGLLSSVDMAGSAVTEIGNNAFYQCYELDEVALVDSVISIGSNAFAHCTSLTSITLSNSLNKIGSNAFYYCLLLNNVVIPDSVTVIDDFAFSTCKALETLKVGNGVTTIGNKAFYSCKMLNNLVLPDSLISIGNNAFDSCSALRYLTLGTGISYIGDYAFQNSALLYITYGGSECSYKNFITLGEGNESLYNKQITYLDPTFGHDLVEHEGQTPDCENVGWSAYVTCTRCDYTTYEEIGALGHSEVNHEGKAATCTEVGYKAYVTCTRCDYTTYEEIEALGHIEVNHEGKAATCTEVGYKAYVTCTRCDYTTYENISPLGHNFKDGTCTECGEKTSESVGLVFIRNADGTFTVNGIGTCTDKNIVIPSSYMGRTVTAIAGTAFEATDIVSVTIPETVTFIGDYAFSGCTSLIRISVSEGNTAYKSVDGNLYTIDGKILMQYAIGKIESSFVIPEGVTTISSGAFAFCTSLKSITIPVSVVEICGSESPTSNDSPFVGVFEGISTTRFNVSAFTSSSLTDVYYGGNEYLWNKIAIVERGNGILLSANMHYTEIYANVNYVVNGEIYSTEMLEVGSVVDTFPTVPNIQVNTWVAKAVAGWTNTLSDDLTVELGENNLVATFEYVAGAKLLTNITTTTALITNLYIPTPTEEELAKFSNISLLVDSVEKWGSSDITGVTVSSAPYYRYTETMRIVYNANERPVEFSFTYDGVTITKSFNFNAYDYFETILSSNGYTTVEKELIYAACSYADAVAQYAEVNATKKFAPLLETYAAYAPKNVSSVADIIATAHKDTSGMSSITGYNISVADGYAARFRFVLNTEAVGENFNKESASLKYNTLAGGAEKTVAFTEYDASTGFLTGPYSIAIYDIRQTFTVSIGDEVGTFNLASYIKLLTEANYGEDSPEMRVAYGLYIYSECSEAYKRS